MGNVSICVSIEAHGANTRTCVTQASQDLQGAVTPPILGPDPVRCSRISTEQDRSQPHKRAMFGIYTQFLLSSNYSYNKNCTISYFIKLISDRANSAISGPTSFRPLGRGLRFFWASCWHVNGGTGSPKLDKIMITIFLQMALIVKKKLHPENFRPLDRGLQCFWARCLFSK